MSRTKLFLKSLFWSVIVGTGTFLAFSAHATDGALVWTNTFPSTSSGEAGVGTAVALDRSGNTYVTGWLLTPGAGNHYATIKYSPDGTGLWTNIFNATNTTSLERGEAIAVDGTGNVFVTGITSSGGYLTIKYSANGVILWTNLFSVAPLNRGTPEALALDGNGDVFVTGFSVGSGTQGDYATIKYSNDGVALWTNHYNGPYNGNDLATALALDTNGNIYVTGSSLLDGGISAYATIKYSNSGIPLWTNLYSSGAVARDLAVDGGGNVYVTGQSGDGIHPNTHDYVTVKYSTEGVALWTNRFDGAANAYDNATAIAVDGGGAVFVTGYSFEADGITSDFATIKYSTDGVPLWTNLFNNPAYPEDAAFALALDGSGNVYVKGNIASGAIPAGYAILKYSGAGVPIWTNLVSGGTDGGGSLYHRTMAVDESGNVYVVGELVSDNDYLYTVKYSGPDARPTIATQPLSQKAVVGGAAALSVTAFGIPTPTYQWLFNGANLTVSSRIVGSSSNVLTISPVLPGDIGNYAVLMTNSSGFTNSLLATLTVVLPPVSMHSVNGGNALAFTLDALPGYAYQLQYKTKLTSALWTNAGASVTATDSTVTVSNVAGPDSQRFFRMSISP